MENELSHPLTHLCESHHRVDGQTTSFLDLIGNDGWGRGEERERGGRASEREDDGEKGRERRERE